MIGLSSVCVYDYVTNYKLNAMSITVNSANLPVSAHCFHFPNFSLAPAINYLTRGRVQIFGHL